MSFPVLTCRRLLISEAVLSMPPLDHLRLLPGSLGGICTYRFLDMDKFSPKLLEVLNPFKRDAEVTFLEGNRF